MPVSIRMGSRRPTRYVFVPGPVIMPGFRPSTRPTRSVSVAVLGNSGSIQVATASHATRCGSPGGPPLAPRSGWFVAGPTGHHGGERDGLRQARVVGELEADVDSFG